jgi:hypothetical protein
MAGRLYEEIKSCMTCLDQGIWRIDFNKLHDVCTVHEARFDGINRNNAILSRNICPAGKCRLNREVK